MITIENAKEVLNYLKQEQKKHEENNDFVSDDALLWGYDMAMEDIENHYIKDVMEDKI